MRSWAAGVLTLVTGCGPTPSYVCSADSQCLRDGHEGVCVEPGFCAFEDPQCPSSLRFGEHAASGLVDQCVEAPVAGTGTTTNGSNTSPLPATSGRTTASGSEAGAGTATGQTTTAPPGSTGSTGSCPPDWWDCAWSARRSIQVEHAGGSLEDFPVQVLLTPERIDFGVAAPDGRDVRFVQNAEELAYEVVTWEPRGATELWVRLPDLAVSDELYLYYGNPEAASASSPAEVWSNDYLSVLHLVDETDVLGSLDLQPVAVEPAPGLLGHGLQFDGASSYLRDDNAPLDLFAPGATITALFHPIGWGEGGFGRIVDASDINTTATGYSLSVAQAGDGGFESIRFGRGYDGNRGTWYSADASIGLDQWIVASVSYAEGADEVPAFWIDGAPSPLVTSHMPAGTPVPPPLALTIGALATTNLRYFDGIIDEVHMSSTPRSDAWIQAEHSSLTDQLLTFGPEELVD